MEKTEDRRALTTVQDERGREWPCFYDRDGRLVVEVDDYLEVAPRIAGWFAWWVNVNLNRLPVRRVTYRPVTP